MVLTGTSQLQFNLYNGFQADGSKVTIILKLPQNTIQMAHCQAAVEPDTV